MANENFNNNPLVDTLYQHIDGGIYQYKGLALHAEDKSEMVIYEHIWPFPQIQYVREKSEFFEKFKPIDNQVLQDSMKIEREIFQQKIIEHKQNRKNLNLG